MSEYRFRQYSRFWLVLLLLCGARELPSAITGGGLNTTFTNSSTFSEQVQTTNLTQRVDLFSTELRARLQGGPLLLDQTFAAPLGDPVVQTALTSAQQLLTTQGAKGFIGPALLSNNTALTSSNTIAGAPIQIATPQVSSTTRLLLGPATIQIGDIGRCQGVDASSVPFGCDPNAGILFAVPAGTENFNTNTHTLRSLGVTNTTTNTFLTSQVYELDGTTASAPASIPEPGTFASVALTLAVLWLGFRVGRRQAVHAP